MKRHFYILFIFISISYVSKSQNWQLQLQRPDLEFSDLHFLNNSEGFAIGDSTISGAFVSSVVLKTVDGGSNWNTYVLASSNQRISKLHPLNTNELFAIGRSGGGNTGLFLKSIDGGLTWNTSSLFNERLNGIYFKDVNTGWVMGKNGLFSKTVDGGLSWTNQNLTSEDLMSMSFFNSTTGILSCDGGELYRTTDGGNSWQPVLSNVGGALLDISISSNNAWICGEAGTIIHSSDFGLTWNVQTGLLPVDYGVISFSDNINGWLAGISGIVYSTNDGGINWQSTQSGSIAEVTGLSVSDAGHGWYCNEEGDIYFFDMTSSINETENSKLSLILFPNPTADYLNIYSESANKKLLILVNNNFQIIKTISIEGDKTYNVDCSDISAGMYYLLDSDEQSSKIRAIYSFVKM